MRRSIAILAGITVFAMSLSVGAQTNHSDDSQEAEANDSSSEFYQFGHMVIDGELKGPRGDWIEGENDEVTFEPLADLDKSFLPEIRESTTGEAFE